MNDLTGAMEFGETYFFNGVEAQGTYFSDAREIAFGLKYSFGENKASKFKNRDVDDNLDRID